MVTGFAESISSIISAGDCGYLCCGRRRRSVPGAQALCNQLGEQWGGCKDGWKWCTQLILTYRGIISRQAEIKNKKRLVPSWFLPQKSRTAEQESFYVLLGELNWQSRTNINSSPEHALLGGCRPWALVPTTRCESLGGKEPARSHQHLSTSLVAIPVF